MTTNYWGTGQKPKPTAAPPSVARPAAQVQPQPQQPLKVPELPPAPQPQAPQQLNNTAQNNPELTGFMDTIRDRIGTQAGREGQGDANLQTQVNRLGERLGSDTRQRATDFAAQDINARARAAQNGLREQMARRGIRQDSGVAAELSANVSNTAMRENARSAAGIGLADEARKDSLVLGGQGIMAAPAQLELQRQAQTNSLYGQAGSAAQAVAGQNLADRNLNLQQFNSQNQQAQAANDSAQRAYDNRIAQLMAFTDMGINNNAGAAGPRTNMYGQVI